MQHKRWILLTALVLVMVVSTASFAVKGMRGLAEERHGEGRKEKIISRMDYAMQELKLTPTQMAQYSSIRERVSNDMSKSFEQRQTMRKAVKQELNKAEPDVRALAETVKSNMQSMESRKISHIDTIIEIYDILTPAQQKQFIQMVKEKMDRMGPRHGKRD